MPLLGQDAASSRPRTPHRGATAVALGCAHGLSSRSFQRAGCEDEVTPSPQGLSMVGGGLVHLGLPPFKGPQKWGWGQPNPPQRAAGGWQQDSRCWATHHQHGTRACLLLRGCHPAPLPSKAGSVPGLQLLTRTPTPEPLPSRSGTQQVTGQS